MLAHMKGLELRKRTLAVASAWMILEITIIETAMENEQIFGWLAGNGWSAGAAVLLVSFGMTVAVSALAEWTARAAAEPEARPDLDAYIDQMIAANGTHLNRD